MNILDREDIGLSQASPCPDGTLYTIRPGDTLFELAGRFDTTVEAILAANPGLDPNNLQIGQIICIPGPPRPGFCPDGTVYVIQPGDTFFLIAQRYGISLQALLAANPGVDPNRLQVGQPICVPAIIAQAPICLIRLRATEQIPPSQLFPAGVVLSKPAAAASETFTVTFTAVGLPEPSAFGNFDYYLGQVTVFPSGEQYGALLGRVALLGQPVTWAGSVEVPSPPSNRDLVEVRPLNIGQGVTGPAVLGGLELFCETA